MLMLASYPELQLVVRALESMGWHDLLKVTN